MIVQRQRAQQTYNVAGSAHVVAQPGSDLVGHIISWHPLSEERARMGVEEHKASPLSAPPPGSVGHLPPSLHSWLQYSKAIMISIPASQTDEASGLVPIGLCYECR